MKSIQRQLQKSYRPLTEDGNENNETENSTQNDTTLARLPSPTPSDSGHNMFVDPDLPTFDTSQIVLQEDIENATKPPPLIFGKCIKINSRQACKIFISVNIGVMFLQLSLHVLAIDENLRFRSWVNRLFFTVEWCLSIYGWYGVTRNRHWKVLLYLCWVVYELTFEFYLIVATLIKIFQNVNTLHEEYIDPKIEDLKDVIENGNLTEAHKDIYKDHHDRLVDAKEQVSDIHGDFIMHVILTYLIIFSVKILNIHCLHVHRKYMEKTYGREPLRTILCCF